MKKNIRKKWNINVRQRTFTCWHDFCLFTFKIEKKKIPKEEKYADWYTKLLSSSMFGAYWSLSRMIIDIVVNLLDTCLSFNRSWPNVIFATHVNASPTEPLISASSSRDPFAHSYENSKFIEATFPKQKIFDTNLFLFYFFCF